MKKCGLLNLIASAYDLPGFLFLVTEEANTKLQEQLVRACDWKEQAIEDEINWWET